MYECGLHFCDSCGDCMHCFWETPCTVSSDGEHVMVQSKSVVVYSKAVCVWCDKAKELLRKHNLHFVEMRFGEDFDADDLRRVIGPERNLTVPQILFDDELVGGYEDLLKTLEPE